MTERQLLDLLCANHERGLIFAAGSTLNAAGHRAAGGLRNKGLLSFGRFVPSPSALNDWRSREGATPSPTPTKPYGTGPIWSEQRKEEFLAALAEKGTLAGALVAIGMSGTSNKTPIKLRKTDPDFAARYDQAKLAWKQRSTALEAQEATAPGAKAEAAVPPDSPFVPEIDGETGREASAPEIDRKPEETSPASRIAPAVPSKPAAADDRDGGTPPAGPQLWRCKPDRDIVEQSLRHRAGQEKIAALRPRMDVDTAKLTLQRKGYRVCRASIVGGTPGLWAVGTLQLTEREMIAKAEGLNR